VIAIGISAGGLEALRSMLAKLPSDCGFALVVIPHWDSALPSVLRGLRSKEIPFSVVEISNGVSVQPNQVYVVPPNKKASISRGTLSLQPITSRDRRHTIDDFMVSLAAEHREAAVGIVLSGKGSDGTRGLAAIKAAGGITFAQDPDTAQSPDIPRHSIQAGGVDFVLSPDRIALELRRLGMANDRKHARKALPETEEFMHAIFGAALDGIVVIDQRGHILEFNSAAERMFGYWRSDVLGREFADILLPPWLRERYRRGLAHYIATGQGPTIGKRINMTAMRADGGELPIELTLVPTELQPPAFVGFLRDIAKREHAEEALRESEESFRLMANSAPVLIWMSGTDRLRTWFNEQWLRFVGRTMAQELGDGWTENVHPQDLDRCLHTLTTHFDARKPFSIEHRLRRYDGQWRWILVNGAPRHDSHKNFAGYIGSCIDITSLKLLQDQQIITEQQLRQRESELAALFDSSPDAKARYDSNLRVTHANAAFGKALGISANSAIGKPRRELPLTQGNIQVGEQLIKKVFQTGHPQRHEFPVRSPQGLTDFEVRYVPEFSTDGSVAAVLAIGRDITELNALNRSIRQRESELVALFDSSPDAHLRFDSNLRVTHANAAYGKLAGLSPKEIVGKTGRELPLPQDDVQVVDRLIKNVFRTGQPGQLELSVPTTKGATLHEIRYVPEFAHDGSVAAVLAVGRDITAQKRMEQALRQRESELSALFGSSPDAYARFDPNLRVTHANVGFEQAMGASIQALVGKTVHQLPLSEDNRRTAEVLMKKVLRTGQSQRYEFSIISNKGVTEYEVRYVPELSTDGSVAAVLGVGRDITERKRMEHALRQREQELTTLFDNSPDVIMRVDRNLRNVYVNATWERVTGISREAAVGKTIQKLGLPPIALRLKQLAVREVLKTRRPKAVEFEYPLATGPIDFEVRHIPEFDNGTVSSVLMIGRDITLQKRLQILAAANERDIRALSANLITAQEQERRRLARDIHDSLCQHLGALAAGIARIAAEFPPSSPSRKHLQAAREHALGAAEEARQIARQLHPAILEDLGLRQALQHLCHEPAQQKDMSVTLRVINPLPEVPLEAATCVYRIAQEALNNAARHAHAKHIWVRLSGTGTTLRLSIQDDGVGFDPDAVRGTGGLGLISMKERARIADATLSVEGRKGRGTRVKLVVPVRGAARENKAHSAGR